LPHEKIRDPFKPQSIDSDIFMKFILCFIIAISSVMQFMHVAIGAEKEASGSKDALSTLHDNGVDIGMSHKSDVLANVSGGIKNGTVWIGHTEARLQLDLEKLLGWESTIAYFKYLSNLGSKFNTHYVGGFTGVDNIEVARNTAQFDDAWIEKSFFKGRFSLRAGLYSIDSEFYVTETSSLFMAPPYGMANEIAQTHTPAIFPLGALALRSKYTTPGENFYVQAALLDGVAGDPNNPYGTHIRLGHGEGTMSIVEFGYTPRDETPTGEAGKSRSPNDAEVEAVLFNKTAVGIWCYTRQAEDVNSAVTRHKRNHGTYVLAERTLYSEKDHPSQGLAGFMRFGTASESVNQVDWTASFGLRYQGLIPGRNDDISGIAVTVNHEGDRFRRANGGDSAETDWEMTYRMQIRPWMALQPNLQYIINPGMDKALENVWVVGLRTEVDF
jgi:porin